MFEDIIYDNHYQGIPLSTEHGPYAAHRLADALATIEGIMESNHRIIASCIELLVPQHNPFRGGWNSDEGVTDFVKKLQHYARWKHTELHKQNPRRRKPVIDAFWQKASTTQGNTCYRIMLLLNHEAFYEQSIGYDPASTLQYRARQSWAKVMQIHQHSSGAYIRFPNHGLLIVNNTAEGLCQLFPKASVLCTAPSQMQGQAFESFGSTRQAKRRRQSI